MLSRSYCFAGWGRGAVLMHPCVLGTLGGGYGWWYTGELLENSPPLSFCKVIGHKSWKKNTDLPLSATDLPSHRYIYWYQKFDPKSHLLVFRLLEASQTLEQRVGAQYLPVSPAGTRQKKWGVTWFWGCPYHYRFSYNHKSWMLH